MKPIEKQLIIDSVNQILNLLVLKTQFFEMKADLLSGHKINETEFKKTIELHSNEFNLVIKKLEAVNGLKNPDDQEIIYYLGLYADLLEGLYKIILKENEIIPIENESVINSYYELISASRGLKKELNKLIENLNLDSFETGKYVYDDRLELLTNSIKKARVSQKSDKVIKKPFVINLLGLNVGLPLIILFVVLLIISLAILVRQAMILFAAVNEQHFESDSERFDALLEAVRPLERSSYMTFVKVSFIGIIISVVYLIVTTLIRDGYYNKIWKLANQGIPSAKYVYASKWKQLYGRVSNKGKREYVVWIINSAEDQYPPACYELGKLYRQGKLVTKDINQAIKYFTLAGDYKDAKEWVYILQNRG